MRKREIIMVEDSMSALVNRWQEEWGKQATADEKMFSSLFISTYEKVKAESVSNKKKNFRMKLIFVIVSVMCVLSYLGFLWYNLYIIKDVELGIGETSLIFFGIAFVAIAIGKWINIKKFQETWVRHLEHQHLLEKEMLMFVYKLKPYSKGNIRQVFMRRVIKIWDYNQEKFVKNMENKESSLLDIFTDFRR